MVRLHVFKILQTPCLQAIVKLFFFEIELLKTLYLSEFAGNTILNLILQC